MSSEFLKNSQIALMKSVHTVQFKFSNISQVQELVQENKFGWLTGAQVIMQFWLNYR